MRRYVKQMHPDRNTHLTQAQRDEWHLVQSWWADFQLTANYLDLEEV